MISKFFIEKPVFSLVISIVIILAGITAIDKLPVQEYPTITPPTINVQAHYPGADAETLAKTVAAPLEEAINGVENMIYMSSTSSPDGTLSIQVTFKIGTDPEIAKVDVNNRVQLALSKLPEEVRRIGVSVRERSPDLLRVFSFTSKNNIHNTTYITNYLLVNVLDEIKRVRGVGYAMIFGGKEYSMRVWLKPDKLAAYNLTPMDVINAIRSQNNQYAAGRIAQEPLKEKHSFTYNIITKGRLKTVNEFKNIIIRANPDGSSLKLKDIARVELGANNYSVSSDYNGKKAVLMGIWLSSGANALDVSKRIDGVMNKLSKGFPKDLQYKDVYNTTKFIKASIHEVIYTLIISILLTVAVIYIFLGTLRSTTIPVFAIPVSIIGTFAGFYAAGFSINLLTLFGLVLAIGLVVDDAIIVIENADRILKIEDLNPKEATIKSMKEITNPLIAIVLVLDAVFIPASFIGGFSGKMYQQFALTIATSVTISGIVALTLTPTLCALILRRGGIRETAFSKAFYKLFNKATEGFTKTAKTMIKFSVVGVVIFAITIGATLILYKMLPTALVPEEDKGDIMVMYYLMPASSLQKTLKVQKTIESIVMSNPNIVSAGYVAGLDFITFSFKTDAGIGWAHLKDWSKRKDNSWDVIKELSMKFSTIKDALVMAFNMPPIMGMSSTGGFTLHLQDRTGGSVEQLDSIVKKLVEEANKDKRLMMVRSSLSTNVPQYKIIVNREKAKSLGVAISSIFEVLQATLGSYYVNDFNMYDRTFRVNIQSDENFRSSSQDLEYIYVRSNTGVLIPLSSLIKIKRVVGPDVIQRFNMFTSATVIGQPRPGYTSGDAMKAISQIAKKILPNGYTIAWSGTSYQEKKLQESGNKVFLYTVVFVFLILAALYESFTIPIAIMIIVPFAVFGAVLGLFMSNLERDIYFNIGILVLIGLSVKNAILLVRFAIERINEGYSLTEATIEAAKIRFRPIVMTSAVFIIASLPLIFWGGAGAISRKIIGITVVSGMLVQTIIGTLFIPMFFYLTMKLILFKKK
ncbi:efflux RND transporter permease subunit [Hippea maritima]|uniref:Transporter, hydrophobe/amphiphile efflux-1 (HAE1) family n=1 Tax=Hippea maritima (strain ATCC 700847 / DSM 10411 / MH2) TaxID=760142 RepID=F2LY60_HIPMA|nr:multidrug efflux RND transporter permease subunit [Hippea maritima]AEA34383.1 transporter, hydrophobe/amphiphile efflux-1 (HAE1) family [Hippea maritima DSM 10411]